MRGIETRRHDTPNFIKQFQTEVLYTLFDCENAVKIYDKTLEEALLCITKIIDKIMTGEIALEDLIISKQLRMNIHNYRSIFPHVATAMQLSNNERVSRGDNIEYVYTDSQHQNPLSRVVLHNLFRTTTAWITTRKSIRKCCWMLLKRSWEFLGSIGHCSVNQKTRSGGWN